LPFPFEGVGRWGVILVSCLAGLLGSNGSHDLGPFDLPGFAEHGEEHDPGSGRQPVASTFAYSVRLNVSSQSRTSGSSSMM